MRNHHCDRCLDSGRVWAGPLAIFSSKPCPQCGGDPEAYWLRKHGRPNATRPLSPPPPPKRYPPVVIQIGEARP